MWVDGQAAQARERGCGERRELPQVSKTLMWTDGASHLPCGAQRAEPRTSGKDGGASLYFLPGLTQPGV